MCLPEEVRGAVVHAMAYSRKDRTLSVRDFVKELYDESIPPAVDKPTSQPAAKPTVESKTEVIGGVKSRQSHKIVDNCRLRSSGCCGWHCVRQVFERK